MPARSQKAGVFSLTATAANALVQPLTRACLAREYLPARMGLATGLTIGVCGGVGGLVAAALGLLGDAVGPVAVLYAIAGLPVLVALLAVRLPAPSAAPTGTIWSLQAAAHSAVGRMDTRP